ncbi:hypothetical protein [Enterococcus sp. 5H]|uniref:hypothetical protein n=1 Tax=Enterococcus sp. 5H TaxID=1229490 RepID=UPI0023022F8B|nr:hypothetical protein [Enterococcus sp. 5H]
MRTIVMFIITTCISVLSLGIAMYSVILSQRTNKQVSLDRINQVNLSLKYDRVFVDVEDIQYKVDVSNGSDLNIYNVTIFAPADIKQMYNGTISIDDKSRPRGYHIGDLEPGAKKTIEFLLINSKEAQLNEFKMKFKTTGINSKDQWWIKEPGKVAEEVIK